MVSMTKRIQLLARHSEGGDPYSLGAVEVDGDEPEALLKQAWEDFQAVHPDCNAMFLDYVSEYFAKRVKVLGDEASILLLD